MGLNAFFVVIGIIVMMLTLANWLGKLSNAGLTATRWFLVCVGALLLIWGLYNTIGARLGLWKPLSLDQWLKPISDAIERFFEWLWNMLAGLLRR